MVHSEARTRFDDVTKNQPSNTWISWVNIHMSYFLMSMVEPGTADTVSVRFGRLFDMRSAPFDFLLGFDLNTLHDLLRVIFP